MERMKRMSRLRLEVAPPLHVKRVTVVVNLFGKDF